MARASWTQGTLSSELHAGGQPGRHPGKKQSVTDATGSHSSGSHSGCPLGHLPVSSNETACLCFSFFSTSISSFLRQIFLVPSDSLSPCFSSDISPLPSLKGPSVFLLFRHAAFIPLTVWILDFPFSSVPMLGAAVSPLLFALTHASFSALAPRGFPRLDTPVLTVSCASISPTSPLTPTRLPLGVPKMAPAASLRRLT